MAQFNSVFFSSQTEMSKCDRLINLHMSLTNLCVASEKLMQLKGLSKRVNVILNFRRSGIIKYDRIKLHINKFSMIFKP